ncbi:MAG: hypothetical protein R3E83_15470 [Burkholderiaceae bacterium]
MKDQGYFDRQAFLRANRHQESLWGPIQVLLVTLTLAATLALS